MLEIKNNDNDDLLISGIPDGLREVYQLVAPELTEVTRLLKEQLRHEDATLDEVIRYSFQLGGKRLRPVLVFLTGKICGGIHSGHIAAATALELIHTGTLVHDDILDGAHFRRHLETMNVRWDCKTVVLAGDYLLIMAMRIMTLVRDVNAYSLMIEACHETCDGELRQTVDISNYTMGVDEYFRIIGGKTAALLQCCCRMGAWFAGADKDLYEHCSQFGFNLGLAFQIIDDILDLTGNEEKTGKTLGTDLLNHKPTLPILLYLKSASEVDRATMLQMVQDKEMNDSVAAEIRTIIKESGSITTAYDQAKSILMKAIGAISETVRLDNATEEQLMAVKALNQVAQFVIDRNF